VQNKENHTEALPLRLLLNIFRFTLAKLVGTK